MSRYGSFSGRHSLGDEIPSLDPRQAQHPGLSLMGMLRNFSIGTGHGLGQNIDGLLQLVSDPYAGGEMVEGLTQAVEHPIQTAGALGQYAKQGISSPLNFGAMLGGLVDPSLVRSVGKFGKPAVNEMTAYHGSPHDFDKFDSTKIGTGEGAQAYGHGLYFAENLGVAKGYQKMFPGNNDYFLGDTKLSGPDAVAAEYLYLANGDKAGALQKMKDAFGAKTLQENPHSMAWVSALDRIDAKKIRVKENKGKLYNVDIPDEAINKMLDWDSPLSEQPEAVRKVISEFDAKYGELYPDIRKAIKANETGERFYKGFGANNPDETSKWLRELGIPGIRYLDAGSRVDADTLRSLKLALEAEKKLLTNKGLGDAKAVKDIEDRIAKANKGTRNFVVFDDKILKILSKE